MALNSSGPLSFGGSTTGQSINLELGVSATALASIDSASFRTLAGVSSGQISVSNFYGKSNISNYIALITAPSQGCTFRGGSVDSQGNYYIGNHNGYADQGMYLKLNTNATAIGFQKIMPAATVYEAKMIASSSSTTAIVTAQAQSNSNQIWFASVNTSTGAVIWQTYISASAYGATYAYNFGYFLASNGNIYSAGYFGGSSTVMRLNSSGTDLGSFTITGQGYGVNADVFGNMYVTYRNSGYGTIAKFDSTATLQWAKRENTGAFGMYGTNNVVNVYASGNVYCMGRQYYGGSYSTNVWKLQNSNGAQLWSRRITSAENICGAMALDSSENIYLCGYRSDTNQALIIKYNNSGTIQWARGFLCSPGNTTVFTSISLLNDNTLYVCGYYTPSTYPTGIVCCFPTDGSKTGTYTVGGVTCTYSALTYTDIAGIDMISAPSPSVSFLSQVSATLSPTDWNASKTSTTI